MTRARSLSRLANTNAFTVDASQNVGIGSTIPDVRLDVNGNMNVSGTLTYEDVTNVDTAGITTTGGLVVTGLGATIGGITTFFGDLNFGAAGVGGTVTPLGHAEFAGVVTATSFSGNGAGLTGVASTDNINTSTLAQFTGGVGIADSIFHIGDSNTAIRFPAADNFTVESAGVERIRVNSGGVLLGLSAGVGEGGTPADLNSTEVGRGFINIARDDTAAADHILFGKNGAIAASVGTDTTNTIVFKTGTTEAARFDSSQRLLVGNTSPRSNAPGADVGFQIEGASGGPTNKRFTQHIFGSGDGSGPYLGLAKHRGTSVGGNTIVVNGDELGGIYFQGADGTNFKQGASILGFVDGTPGSNDMPGRLVFSTTADGASSVTERLRIDSAGRMGLGVAPSDFGTNRIALEIHSPSTTVTHLALTNSTTGSDGSSNGFNIIQNGLNTLLYLRESGFMSFSTANAERLRIASAGQIGLGGANYGTSGQVLTSNGSSSAVTWEDASGGGGITTQVGNASGIVTSMFLTDATDHKITATGICTITTTQSGTEGQSHTIRIVNSGSATVGFSTYFLFPSGAAPSLPTADGAVSLISFTVHDSVGAGCTQLLAGASVNFS